jgi:serine/threonine-protein kinase
VEPFDERPWWRRPWVIALAVIALLLAGVAAFALTRGDGTANVPLVLGDTVDEARAKIERAGFDFAQVTAPTCNPRDTVTEQDPPARASADKGSTVTVTVSLGLQKQVPDVVGMPEQAAVARIKNEDLLAKSVSQASRTVKADRVISTDPAAGVQAECQSTVTLTVSKGATEITVPDLVGDQQEVAESKLNKLKLIPNVDTRDADEPEGTVIDQEPAAGAGVLRGDTVTLVVSTGAGSVLVPDVVGQSEDAAKRALSSRSLGADVVEQETTNSDEDGRVLEQAPGAGSRVRAGDPVTIVVGVFEKPESSTTTTTTTDETTTTVP